MDQKRINQKGFIGWIILAFVAGALVLLFTKSSTSLPGEWDYPVKKVKEEIYLETNSLNYEGRINANIVLANERLSEIVKLIEIQGNEALIKDNLERLTDNDQVALNFAVRIKNRGSYTPEYFNKIETALNEHKQTLQGLYYHIGPTLYENLDRALDIIDGSLQTVKSYRSSN